MHAAVLNSARFEDTGPTAAPQSIESLGRRICAALPPLRLHSVSICDNQCNVLWLSEGTLGPDEHALVTDALERFASAGESFEECVEDGRVAVFLAVRAARVGLVGVVMVLADTKAGSEGLLGRIATGSLHALIRELGAAIPHAPARRLDHDPTGMLLSLAEEPSPGESGSVPVPPRAEDLAPAAVDALLGSGELSLELERPAAPTAAAEAAPAPSLAPTPAVPQPASAASTASSAGSVGTLECLALELMPFVKLRSGGRMRRFEVLPRGTPRQNRDPGALDALALQSLLAWMAAHRADWTLEPTSFTLNLSIATLEDEQFLRHLGADFSRSNISPESIGFEISEPLCTQRRASVERFISGCERLGCFVVIDGFTFDSAVVPLLRSKAVRMVKIEPRLCAAALKDKLSQALVVAIVQAVKVLGIHCAAQQIETQQALRWLTAVGCDFGHGSILARPLPIARLQAPARPSTAAQPSADGSR